MRFDSKIRKIFKFLTEMTSNLLDTPGGNTMDLREGKQTVFKALTSIPELLGLANALPKG